MKTTKKLMSLVLAVILMFSMTTFAMADFLADGSESASVSGSGTTEYVDTQKYSAILPTSETLDFTLDPQGLLGITDGQMKSLDELESGKVIAGDPVAVVNNSSFPVKLTAKFTLTGDATAIAYITDDDTTIAKVEDDTDNNVLLYVEPSGADVTSTADVVSAYSASGKGYVIGKAGADAELTFTLGKATYKAKNTLDVYSVELVDGTGHGTAFQLGGYSNSKANWKDYSGSGATKNVGVGAVFTLATDDSGTDTTYVTGVPGLRDVSLDSLTVTPATPTASYPNGAGFITATNAETLVVTTTTALGAKSVKANTALSLPFYFGGKAIDTVTVNGTANTASFTTGAESITFTFSTTGSKVIVIKLADSATTYTVTITVS